MSGFPLPPFVAEFAAKVAGAALMAFLRTTFGMITAGVLIAIGSFWYAGQGSTWRGLLAGGIALGLCVVLGLMLAGKRAALTGVRELMRKHRVGGRVVDALFDRLAALPGVSMVERIPLAQAEVKLTEVITGWLAGAEGGFIRRKLEAKLVENVRSITLARFREVGTREGGIQLSVVRGDLSAKADVILEDQANAMIKKVTFLLCGAALVLSCVAAVGIRRM